MWEEDPDGELGLWIDEDVFGLDAGKWIGGGRKAVVGEEPLDTAAFEDAEGREELEDNPISIAGLRIHLMKGLGKGMRRSMV